ncbi:uncharacterized protein BDR25DRAFT_350218 [Lindgomyces ingoldianus]|uniref:Uncharacterized protein n=1 Tax=Lindgomyces ingoldianus TaxID=673940 RepID=A0ACB6RB13_9PLEO|nr:uncharacterized protein BDR25DRAFT_350218 [Lindgomyces ingoldianus]KAF2475943.1 hypothetical protein BDR25DRAFT_350218 [Lindgomyces ingoldianus]
MKLVRQFHYPSGDCNFSCQKFIQTRAGIFLPRETSRSDISSRKGVPARFVSPARRPRIFLPGETSHQINCPGEASPDLSPGRTIPVRFLFPERHPGQICLPGEASPHFSPGRNVPVKFLFPERLPSQICLPGEVSSQVLFLVITSRQNAYTRVPNTYYTVIKLSRKPFSSVLMGSFTRSHLYIFIQLIYLLLKQGRICSFVLDSLADSSDSSRNVEHLATAWILGICLAFGCLCRTCLTRYHTHLRALSSSLDLTIHSFHLVWISLPCRVVCHMSPPQLMQEFALITFQDYTLGKRPSSPFAVQASQYTISYLSATIRQSSFAILGRKQVDLITTLAQFDAAIRLEEGLLCPLQWCFGSIGLLVLGYDVEVNVHCKKFTVVQFCGSSFGNPAEIDGNLLPQLVPSIKAALHVLHNHRRMYPLSDPKCQACGFRARGCANSKANPALVRD